MASPFDISQWLSFSDTDENQPDEMQLDVRNQFSNDNPDLAAGELGTSETAVLEHDMVVLTTGLNSSQEHIGFASPAIENIWDLEPPSMDWMFHGGMGNIEQSLDAYIPNFQASLLLAPSQQTAPGMVSLQHNPETLTPDNTASSHTDTFVFVNEFCQQGSKKRKREPSPELPILDFKTVMDPSQPEQYVFQVQLPHKVPRFRKRRSEEIMERKKISEISPCLRCRLYKLKCGAPCLQCPQLQPEGQPLWKTICCRVDILSGFGKEERESPFALGHLIETYQARPWCRPLNKYSSDWEVNGNWISDHEIEIYASRPQRRCDNYREPIYPNWVPTNQRKLFYSWCLFRICRHLLHQQPELLCIMVSKAANLVICQEILTRTNTLLDQYTKGRMNLMEQGFLYFNLLQLRELFYRSTSRTYSGSVFDEFSGLCQAKNDHLERESVMADRVHCFLSLMQSRLPRILRFEMWSAMLLFGPPTSCCPRSFWAISRDHPEFATFSIRMSWNRSVKFKMKTIGYLDPESLGFVG